MANWRGTELACAPTVFEAEHSDISANIRVGFGGVACGGGRGRAVWTARCVMRLHLGRLGALALSARGMWGGQATGWVSHDRGYLYEWRRRSITFYTSTYSYRAGATPATTGEATAPVTTDGGADGFQTVPVPDDMDVGAFSGCVLLELRADWEIKGRSMSQRCQR